MAYLKPKPQPDPDSKPFWDGLREGKLMIQRCNDCARYLWAPKPFCNWCHQPNVSWVEAPARGTLATWTVQHHVVAPGFADEVPYTTLAVALEVDPACKIIGNLRGADPSGLRIGMPMEGVFEEADNDLTLLHWRPA